MRCGRGIFSDAGFRTTSFGSSASGVRDVGGVPVKGRGGNPGRALSGVGVAVTGGAPGSIPAARNLSRREEVSGTGVALDGVAGGGW